jgi:GxxExxY protein
MLHEDLTKKIIGAAMRVHSELKSGFQEKIYQTALEIELRFNNISFIAEREMDIFYRNQVIGKRRVDFLVENKIVVEIKAVSKLEDIHLAQTLNYLECMNLSVGLLINFGAQSLEFKRLHNNKFLDGQAKNKNNNNQDNP